MSENFQLAEFGVSNDGGINFTLEKEGKYLYLEFGPGNCVHIYSKSTKSLYEKIHALNLETAKLIESMLSGEE